MDTLVVFLLFFIALVFSISNHISILFPLLLGLLCFIFISLRRGYTSRQLLKMILLGSKKSFIVIRIFILIGIITAVWRACGTIPFIVYYGVHFISGQYFILASFLLSCLVSFLLGTSFGTVGTMGVVLMVLARSGNVDTSIAAGAIIAGAYFGDRCSPMSSSANLIAALTHTRLYINMQNMLKTSLFPFILSVIAYMYLSSLNPLSSYDNQIGDEILMEFNLHAIVIVPAVIILLLALLRIDVKISMTISILSGVLISIYLQQMHWSQMIHYVFYGYSMQGDGLFSQIIKGGGLFSMINVSLIVLISSSYAGLFEGTGLLKDVEQCIEQLSQRIRVFPSMILTSLATAAFSCNQTLAVILTHQFAHPIYAKRNMSKYRLALDLENTVIVISALIPWNIAGAVPAAALSTDASFIPYAFYLFLVPLTNLFLQNTSLQTEQTTGRSITNRKEA